MWIEAITVDVCKECGSDIFPGEQILRTWEREADIARGTRKCRVTFCKDCGELSEESLEFGKDGN